MGQNSQNRRPKAACKNFFQRWAKIPKTEDKRQPAKFFFKDGLKFPKRKTKGKMHELPEN